MANAAKHSDYMVNAMLTQFQLSEVEARNAEDFIAKQQSKQATPCSAIGGRWTFCFTITSIGNVCIVRDCLLKEEQDITDYENF